MFIVAVIDLGNIGLSLAVVFGKSFDAIGCDPSEDNIDLTKHRLKQDEILFRTSRIYTGER